MNYLWSNGYLSLVMKTFAFKFWLSLLYILTPSPNDVVFCFNQFHKQFIVSICIYISGTVIHLVRDPSQKRRRPVLSSKAVLLLPESEPFHNLWFNSSANKLAPLPGTSWRLSLEERQELHNFRKEISGENRNFCIHEKVVYLSWRLHTHFDQYHTRYLSFQKDPHKR